MANRETSIQNVIRMALSGGPIRVFRNHVGGGYFSRNPRPGSQWHDFGLAAGSGDIIGWKSVTVTPEMVGKKIAVFLSIEVKTEEGAMEPKQKKWLETVLGSGGIAGVARSVEEAWEIVNGTR